MEERLRSDPIEFPRLTDPESDDGQGNLPARTAKLASLVKILDVLPSDKREIVLKYAQDADLGGERNTSEWTDGLEKLGKSTGALRVVCHRTLGQITAEMHRLGW